LQTEKFEKIQESLEALSRNTETLLVRAEGFPALEQNTKRVNASIRMMQIALGQVTMTPKGRI
jgi:hypothetical protein